MRSEVRYPSHTQSFSMMWLLPIALVAVLVHGIAYVCIRAPASPDAAEYLALGKSLATHGELVLPTGDRAKRMPFYPAIISLLYHGQSDEKLESDVLAAQCVISIFATVLIAMIAWMLMDRRAGILAGLISALYAPHLYLQTLCLTECLLIQSLVLALFSYLLFLVAERQTIRWTALAITALALVGSSLTRANAAVFALVFALDALFRPGRRSSRYGRTIILVFPAAAALMCWGIRNQHQVGAFTLSTSGGLNYYLGHNETYATDPGLAHADYDAFDRIRRETGVTEVEADRQLYSRGKEFAKHHLSSELANACRKLIVYHTSTIATCAPTLLLIILGAVFLTTRSKTPGEQATAFRSLSLIGLVITLVVWLAVFWQTKRPWISPSMLVPLGLVSLLLLRTRPRVRGFFITLYLAELLVAIDYIPLVRLRWTIDFLLILSIAIAVSRLCNWVKDSATEKLRPSPTNLPG